MSGNDQYGRRLLLWGDTAEIFGFTFWYTDALSSVCKITMFQTRPVTGKTYIKVQYFWVEIIF